MRPRLRLHTFSALLLVLLLAACDACGAGQVTEESARRAEHAAVASAIASGANAALPVLAEAMERQGMLEIEKAESRAEAERALEEVEARWAPVWEAWRLLVIAQDAYATAVESGEDTAAHLGNLKARYCELRALWPDKIPGVPLGLVVCHAAPPAALADAGADAATTEGGAR